MSNVTLYRHPLSGHSHRVQLLLSILNVDAEIIDVDLKSGAHKQDTFLEKNPLGQVPVLEVDDLHIYDSNAILTYIAAKYDDSGSWLPRDPATQASIQQILTVAAGPLAYGPARARLITVFGAGYDAATTIAQAHTLLASLELRLNNSEWISASHPTIADIALYSYVAHAPEGNVSLASYHNIRDWLARIEDLPGFVPMTKTAVGLAA